MESILPKLNVKIDVNESALWADDGKDELFIEEKLENTWDILARMEFTPSAITYTLYSIILYTIIATILITVLFVIVCKPSCCSCRRCCRKSNTMRPPEN